ncbi:uncharacterized protein LOC132753025 [Ruditapes philippinarum]|uniref:uncharacterized protein LOC132753025 n=1 Tax=Ruditapes philippinarum TaxID=129788 RepID=UPI00295B7C4A|nr:uncharacterized protein LOC132753025 [Ruditapes philippinarum]
MKPSASALLMLSMLLSLSSNSMGEMNVGYKNSNRQDLKHFLGSQERLSKRSTSNIVDIAMFTQRPNQVGKYSIYVDSTMSRLMIEIKADRSTPVSSLLKPSGALGPHPKLNGNAQNGTVTARFDVAISQADFGLWKLEKLDASAWTVKIQGESTMDFTYQFLKGNKTQTAIKGDPVQGETYKTVVNIAEYGQVKTVDIFLVFVTEKFTPADMMFPVVAKGNGKYELAKLKMLDRKFMIGIQGKDNSSNTFRRIKFVNPVSLLLSVPMLTDPATKLYEQTRLDILITVTNIMPKQQDVDISITDTQGLAQEPRTISATILPGGNYTAKFVLDGGLQGVETSVTIAAKPFLGRGQESMGPSITRNFTVESNKTTSTSKITTTVTTSTVTSRLTTLATTTSANIIATNHAQKSDPVTTQAGSKTVSANRKAVTMAPNNENKEPSFSKGDLFGVASISGVSAGVLIGVAALITMRLVFRQVINKNNVKPETDGK